jgi:hypothetical protein
VDVAAAGLDWRGPAEIVPLPAAEIVARGVPVPGSGTVVTAADSRSDAAAGTEPGPSPVFARAAYLGRGRIYASGLETWPWAMEAGFAAEHQVYWESVVEWLASGLADDMVLAGEPGVPWTRWEARLEGDIPASLTLHRPASPASPASRASPAAEAMPVEPLPTRRDGMASATVAFVPVAEGAHALVPLADGAHALGGDTPPPRDTGGDAASARPAASDADSTSLGTVAAPPAERLSWTAAAAAIGAAGGRIVSGDDARTASDARPVRPSGTLPWIAFLLLASLAVAGWTARRVGGRP